MRICTWNVRSIYRAAAVTQLEKVISNFKADITALQEIRWTSQGQTNLSSCDVYYSGHAFRHEFGCGFAVVENLRDLVARFTAVDKRLTAIRIKKKIFPMRRRRIRMTQPRMPFTKFYITYLYPILKFCLATLTRKWGEKVF